MVEIINNNGYKGKGNTSPDVSWWMEQIKKGAVDREKRAYEKSWAQWRSYYRGDWKDGVMPVNLFYTMVRSTIPRIYFRNPTISISAAKPGFLHMAFAKILERADNKMLRQMKIKRHMKRGIQDAFMFGTGFMKIGFGGFHQPSPYEDSLIIGKDGTSPEFADLAGSTMPWISRVRPGNIILPAGLENFEHTRWIAERIVRPLADVKNDARLQNTKNLQGVTYTENKGKQVSHPVTMIELYEIRDRKTGRVMVLAPESGYSEKDKILYDGPDGLQQYGNLPYFPIIFNEDDETAWGLPDSKILEPQQLELNETRTQIMMHRRISLVKILVQEGRMSPEEAERLVSEDVGAVAFVKGRPSEAVQVIQGGSIPRELFESAEAIMQDVRETVGFSRNQFGEYAGGSGDTTATEAQIVRQATEIRIDERRDMVADTLQDMVTHMHGLLFENWGEEEIIDVIGPGGIPIWVQFRGDLIQNGRYSVHVDPDSGVPETRALREQRAMKAYEVLKQNPLIDPMKLTQYLLNELNGVEFDTLMRMLPAPAQVPQGPVPAAEFGNMLASSMQTIGG